MDNNISSQNPETMDLINKLRNAGYKSLMVGDSIWIPGYGTTVVTSVEFVEAFNNTARPAQRGGKYNWDPMAC